MANNKMTQKQFLAFAIAALEDAGNDEAATRGQEWLDQLNKPKKKGEGKDSATLKRENRAIEVAGIINEGGMPMTIDDLKAKVSGWPVNTKGEISSQAVSGCMRTALRMGLVKFDKNGEKGKTRYLPLEYVEEVEEEE